MRTITMMAGVAAMALVACTPEVDMNGARIFAENCSGCHGDAAKGDGPMAATLAKTPPDLTTLSQRYGGTFPRDYVMTVVDGYARGSHFSPDMPEFGAGDLGPMVMVDATPVPAKLLALADYLESIQQ